MDETGRVPAMNQNLGYIKNTVAVSEGPQYAAVWPKNSIHWSQLQGETITCKDGRNRVVMAVEEVVGNFGPEIHLKLVY